MTQILEQSGFDTQNEDTLKDKYLTFSLADEDYGIEIRYVIEIIGIQKITKVPNLPDFIKGVINLRGKVIPVMDVRARFNIEARDYDERTCIVVVNIDGEAMGLVVDHVNEVADIPEGQVEPPPSSAHSQASRYISGIGKMEDEVKILLDVERLISQD
jgi:purine-binding chemotaxis protein CheW